MIRILILEDDAEMQTLIKIVLEREGYEPVGTNNSQDAVNLLQDGSYQLLIMDSTVRELDWWEFYKSMKADTILQTIGIIVLLARITPTKKGAKMFKQIQDNGDGFLPKPVDIKELVEVVKKVLGNYGDALAIVE